MFLTMLDKTEYRPVILIDFLFFFTTHTTLPITTCRPAVQLGYPSEKEKDSLIAYRRDRWPQQQIQLASPSECWQHNKELRLASVKMWRLKWRAIIDYDGILTTLSVKIVTWQNLPQLLRCREKYFFLPLPGLSSLFSVLVIWGCINMSLCGSVCTETGYEWFPSPLSFEPASQTVKSGSFPEQRATQGSALLCAAVFLLIRFQPQRSSSGGLTTSRLWVDVPTTTTEMSRHGCTYHTHKAANYHISHRDWRLDGG